MCQDLVVGVELPVLVLVSTKGLLCVLDQVSRTKSISNRVPDRESCSRQAVVRIVVPRERVPVCNSKNRHLEADQGVLDGRRQIVLGVAFDIVGDRSQPDQNGQGEALPVRCEDNELDAQELRHGPEGLQVVVHAHPEQAQRIQTQRDTDVVDDAAPQVARANVDIALLVCARGFHYDGRDAQNRLQPCVLKDAPLDGKEGIGVGNVDGREDVVQGPQVIDGGSAMGRDNQVALAAEVVDQELEESIDGEGLVHVADRIEPLRSLEGYKANPRGDGVDGHPGVAC